MDDLSVSRNKIIVNSDVVRIFESDVCDVDMVANPDSDIFEVASCFQAQTF